jgi:hypothetical protein
MTDVQDRIQRALGDSENPLDPGEESPLTPDPPPDRTKNLTRTSFSRMRTTWQGEDAVRLEEVKYQAERLMRDQFKVALDLMDQLYETIRTPRTDDDGMPARGPGGRLLWVCDEDGNPDDDWSRLTPQLRSRFLFAITTHLYEWEQHSVTLWGEAMFAKVQWEEKFAAGFLNLPGVSISGKPTEADRTQAGHRHSIDNRYFAVFQAILSRKADALVRSLTRLQRLLSDVSAE